MGLRRNRTTRAMLVDAFFEVVDKPLSWLFSKVYFPAHEFMPYSSEKQANGNPDPDNYKVLDHTVYSDLRSKKASTIMVVRYPGCSNYDGLKVLVYDFEVDTDEMERLDPHFFEDGQAPFARFEPTDRGYAQAEELAMRLIQGES